MAFWPETRRVVTDGKERSLHLHLTFWSDGRDSVQLVAGLWREGDLGEEASLPNELLLGESRSI